MTLVKTPTLETSIVFPCVIQQETTLQRSNLSQQLIAIFQSPIPNPSIHISSATSSARRLQSSDLNSSI
ncbi:hypothetical protein LINGRAHAP2_LOCUS25520 [Linum grandiflorum]